MQLDPNFYFIYDKMRKHEKLFDKLNRHIPVIEPNQVVNAVILQQLQKDLSKYKQVGRSVIHINSVKIEDIISKKLKYAKGYLMNFEKWRTPLLFQPVFNKQDRYLLPVAITPELNRYLDMNMDTIYEKNEQDFENLVHLFRQITYENQNKPLFPYVNKDTNQPDEEVIKVCNNYWKIPFEQMTYQYKNGILYISYPIEAIDFNYMNWLESLVHVIEGDTPIPFIEFGLKMKFDGTVCYVTTDNVVLIECAKIVQQHYNYFEFKKFYESIEDELLQIEDKETALNFVYSKLKQHFLGENVVQKDEIKQLN